MYYMANELPVLEFGIQQGLCISIDTKKTRATMTLVGLCAQKYRHHFSYL